MQNQLCIHCIISGKVQGVWFRASTKEEADRLSLTGWVRNLPDGRVEVLACGDVEKIKTLQTWLKHGPLLAKVADFLCEETSFQELHDFEIL